MNNRQTELLETISKHSLLICLMVSGNVIWSIWLAVPYGDNNGMGNVISSYIFMFVNLLQLICLYLGFPFAKERYDQCCPNLHKCCERYCRRIAVRATSRSIQNYYRLLAEDSISDDRLWSNCIFLMLRIYYGSLLATGRLLLGRGHRVDRFHDSPVQCEKPMNCTTRKHTLWWTRSLTCQMSHEALMKVQRY